MLFEENLTLNWLFLNLLSSYCGEPHFTRFWMIRYRFGKKTIFF